MPGGRDKALRLLFQMQQNVAQQTKEIEKALGGAKKEAEKTKKSFGSMGDIMKTALAFKGVQAAIRLGKEVVGLGMEASRLTSTFYNLGGSAEGLEQLRSAARGMVDDVQLMQAANKFLAMGLAESTAEAAELTEMATQLGSAMSMDAGQAMGDFAAMLANQSIPRLDNFGISSGKVRARIKELQSQTKDMSREAAFMQAVMEEGATSMARIGDQSDSTAAQTSTLQTSITNLKIVIGQALEETMGLSGALAKLVNQITEASTAGANAGDSLGAFDQQLTKLTEYSVISQTELLALKDQSVDLRMEMMKDGKTVHQLESALQRLLPAGADAALGQIQVREAIQATEAEMRKEMATLRAYKSEMGVTAEETAAPTVNAIAMAIQAMEQLPPRMRGMNDELAFEAQRTREAMAGIFGGEEMQNQMIALQQVISGHEEAIANIESSYAQRRTDSLFMFNLQRAQAEQQYQQQRQALISSGQMQEAAELATKYQAQQQQATGAYDVQQQLAERSHLAQLIEQKKAHIAELQEQRDQTLRVIAEQIKRAQQEDRIGTTSAGIMLALVDKYASEKLKRELEIGRKTVEIANLTNETTIAGAITTFDALIALQNQNRDAAVAELGKLRDQFENFKVELPPLPALDTKALSGSVGKAAQAVKPATQKLANTVADMHRGVDAAMKAIRKLMIFDVPKEADRGIERLGAFMERSVTILHAAMGSIEGKSIEAVASVAKLVDRFASAFSEIMTFMQQADFAPGAVPDLAAWAIAFEAMIIPAMAVLSGIEARLGYNRVKKLARTTERIGKMVKGVVFDFSQMEVTEPPDMSRWASVWTAAMAKIVETIESLTRGRGKWTERIQAAVAWIEPIKELLDFGGVKVEMKTGTLPEDMALWGDQLVQATQAAADALDAAEKQVGAAQIQKAAAISGGVKKVLDVLGIDFAKMSGPIANFETNLEWTKTALDRALLSLVPWLHDLSQNFKELSEQVEYDVLEEVSKTAESLKSIIDVIGLGGVFKDMKVSKINVGALTRLMAAQLTTATDIIVPVLLAIGEKWGDAVEVAGNVSKDVASVWTNIAKMAKSIDEAAWVGGIDVGAARAMMMQFQDLMNPPEGMGAPTMATTFGGVGAVGAGGNLDVAFLDAVNALDRASTNLQRVSEQPQRLHLVLDMPSLGLSGEADISAEIGQVEEVFVPMRISMAAKSA